MPGLEDLYREIILDHYRTPRNRGTLEVPPAKFALGHNPLCGDEIQIFVMLEDGIVTDVKASGQGCSISQSSASLMTTALIGKPLPEALRVANAFRAMLGINEVGSAIRDDDERVDYSDVRMGDLEALKGVAKFTQRIKCATLGWNTFAQAVDDAS